MILRNIPCSGEPLPVIGIGTWQTFDVTGSSANSNLREVLTTIHAGGGLLIDSSPMYGKAEQVIGDTTSSLAFADDFFYATKVWTTGRKEGITQLEDSMRKMKRNILDLVQVHNLLDLSTHLKTLHEWKSAGRIRYIGITHYTDAYHDELERVIRSEKPDFVQFNYSLFHRNAEQRLLNVAKELGVATIINRPFGEGSLFKRLAGHPLPPWAADWDIHSWATLLLKYIISHEAVTCVIPATSNPKHAKTNIDAGDGLLPDEVTRKKMVNYIRDL